MSLSTAAIREIHQLQTEAEQILSASSVTRAQQKRADVIISKISSIRATGQSSDELNRVLATEIGREIGNTPNFRAAKSPEARAYTRWLKGASAESVAKELRTGINVFLTNPQTPPTIGHDVGDLGGFLVPMEYSDAIVEGMKLADPLLDDSVVTVIREKDFSLRPLQIPGWDLSGVAAVMVGENVRETAATIPTLNQPLLNKFCYRTAFDMSMEFEEDAITAYGNDTVAALSRAQGIAIARGVGADLVNGDGSSAPAGIVTGSHDSGVTTANTGAIVHDDLSSVFYSVDRIYRNSPKCAWLVSDAVEKQIRNAKDSSNRPLFATSDGVLQVFGKPVYVCPSLPNYNASLGTQKAGSFCVFGDLSHYVAHTSAVLQRRFTQSAGLIEYGMARFHSLIFVDAVVADPTSGSAAPIVSARLKS
jgi:HK97 family phage major capsid protein